MKLIRLFFLSLILVSCSNNNQKKVKINYTIDYTELDNFIKDSLPVTLDLDSAYYQTFNKWKDISLINSVKKIPFVDSRQLSFPINLLKTDILKINGDEISDENISIFKSHIKDIINSYNALVNMMNIEVKKSNEININLD